MSTHLLLANFVQKAWYWNDVLDLHLDKDCADKMILVDSYKSVFILSAAALTISTHFRPSKEAQRGGKNVFAL